MKTLLKKLSKLWRLARAVNSHINGGNISHKAPVSRSTFWSNNSWDWGILKPDYKWERIPSSFFNERKTVEDETVKINCIIWDCKYNLYHKTEKQHCQLKYIDIGTKIISGFEHGVEGACLNMKIGGS